MDNENIYRERMNASLSKLVYQGLKISLRSPSTALFLFKTLLWQRKAAKTRDRWHQEGIQVPPFMITSITSSCNLRCKGCYAMVHQNPGSAQMEDERLQEIIGEAKELGVSFMLLAGGEPLVRKNILQLIQRHKEVIFPLFTNGMLVDDEILDQLEKQKNVIPVISLEGSEADTDLRRGSGVYRQVLGVFESLRKRRIFFGTSLTVTRANMDTLTDAAFVGDLVRRGCKLLFFVEYVPVKEGTGDLTLTQDQRAKLTDRLEQLRKEYPALFLAFPGDEEKFGGCMSAGRGFVHINPEGSLEPCPFAPFSDTSLKEMPLKAALKSDFLRQIRENHAQLTETVGGCALWEKRAWVQSLLK